MTEQLRSFCVCQICGVGTSREDAEASDWLVSPYKRNPDLLVIRCPRHISEWSLRQSYAGRTKEWREKMARGRTWSPPPIPPHLSPIPMFDPPDYDG